MTLWPAHELDAPADAEQVQRILRERARTLARPPTAGDSSAILQVLTFEVGGQRFGVETRHVREVLRRPQLAYVGASFPAAVGVINLRGTILTVVDLETLTGVVSGASAEWVIVLDGAGPPLGVRVDALHEDLTLTAAEVSAPAARTAAGTELVQGVTPQLVILDGERLLTDPRLFATEPRSS